MPVFDIDHAEAFLQAAARAEESVSYKEMIEALGFPFSRPLALQLCRVLTEIDARAEARGEPGLAVLVVRQADRIPGQGWWMSHVRANGYAGPFTGPAAMAEITPLQRVAFRHWRRSAMVGGQ